MLEFNLETLGFALNLAFIFLVIREKIICWPFGIAGSLLSISLFIDAKLYSESILFLYYVVMGFYGWINWSRAKARGQNKLPIVRWSLYRHLYVIGSGVLLTVGLGAFFKHFTDANNPYEDAFSTIFSFAATYLETKKVLYVWIYWIILNTFSIWLYHVRGLEWYSIQMVIFSVLSVWGLVGWLRSYKAQSVSNLVQ